MEGQSTNPHTMTCGAWEECLEPRYAPPYCEYLDKACQTEGDAGPAPASAHAPT